MHRWEASGSLPGMTSLYLGVMDALYAINTDTIFFVEGKLYITPISSTFSDCCLWNMRTIRSQERHREAL
jgi:hypothetical protein